MNLQKNSQAPVVKGISRRPPEPEVGVRIPAGVPIILMEQPAYRLLEFYTQSRTKEF